MWKLALSNKEKRYLFVAVDVSSRYLWVEPLKVKMSQACKEAPKIIAKNGKTPVPKVCSATNQPEMIWVRGREFAKDFAIFCRSKGNEIYSTKSDTKSDWRKEIFCLSNHWSSSTCTSMIVTWTLIQPTNLFQSLIVAWIAWQSWLQFHS